VFLIPEFQLEAVKAQQNQMMGKIIDAETRHAIAIEEFE